MRGWLLLWLLSSIPTTGAGCAGSEPAKVMPPKRPNDELIVGEYERHPPQTPLAMRFRANGELVVAATKDKLDASPTEADGTYALDKDQLTLTFTGGEMCEVNQPGVYKVVVSKLGIRFTKIEDDCERRAKFDGQTFWRIK
jgi:hypothetical protein